MSGSKVDILAWFIVETALGKGSVGFRRMGKEGSERLLSGLYHLLKSSFRNRSIEKLA
ncbi:MAG TPA: hypothetical protein VGZ00_10490 [Candidatus Baltobacteraceae bacterium]|jgi:hypothetical protein|nr:hypothetical protein [Candidatus Baltobacteraceae bacterium]